MKKLLLIIAACFCCSQTQMFAVSIDVDKQLIERLQSNQVRYENQVRQLQASVGKANEQLRVVKKENADLDHQIDSLKSRCSELEKLQASDKQQLTGKIANTDKTVNSNRSTLQSRTKWGIGITLLLLALLAALALLANAMRKKIKRGDSSIDEVRKAQEAMQEAQIKMQEESVRLDNKLVELLGKQLTSQQQTNSQEKASDKEVDHSLALKIADEITRIEKNLTRMDASVKGYKPLVKAIERIKDNFKANGYDIVTYIGQTYNEGMRVNPEFVIDEELPVGTRIITSVSKPQVHYNGELIQKATLTVSQNI